jgi:predicted phage baseplate assembly protein
LSREGTQTDIVQGPIRLVRNLAKNVTEVWVTWSSQPNLLRSGPDDRHYFVDRARGLLFFGDGTQGKIPPPTAQILARQYQTGGGSSGNVAARTITQLQNAIPGIQAAFNPRPAEGGADGETLAALSARAPMTVRHRGRAIEPADYETMAHEASPAVAIARAIPTRDPNGRPLPGWITLVIIPGSQDARPWPSFGMRQEILAYIAERAPADIVAAGRLYVTGPNYLPVDVTATIAPVDFNSVGSVEKDALQTLTGFLHPLRGGLDGHGWAPGAGVYLSDVARALERVGGIDYIADLELALNGRILGDFVPVAPDQIVAAGQVAVKIIEAEVNR